VGGGGGRGRGRGRGIQGEGGRRERGRGGGREGETGTVREGEGERERESGRERELISAPVGRCQTHHHQNLLRSVSIELVKNSVLARGVKLPEVVSRMLILFRFENDFIVPEYSGIVMI
jgi:hypothetical protein